MGTLESPAGALDSAGRAELVTLASTAEEISRAEETSGMSEV
jgi:hypothetical protein